MSEPDTKITQRLTSLRLGVIAFVAGTLLFASERIWAHVLAEGGALPLRSAIAWWGANVGISFAVCVAAGLAFLVSRLVSDTHPVRRALLGAALFAAGAGALAAPIGADLASGGWVAQQSWGALVRFLPTALSAAVGASIYVVVALLRDRFGIAIGSVLLAGGVVAVAVDHVILLGIYPDLHLTLHFAAIMSLCAGLAAIPWRLRRPAYRAAGVVALIVAAGAPALWMTVPLGYRPQLSMSSSMANVLMEVTMPKIELEFAEREFASVDLSTGHYLPQPRGDELPRNDWNVLWVTVDTLRWNALWPERSDEGYSFARPGDTPFLDRWLAEETVVFEHAYAHSSATRRSMPPMFKSLEAYEPTMEMATPLGTAATRSGRTSIAVVNNLFLEPRTRATQSLLWGFDIVEVYHKKRQEKLVGQIDEAMARHADGFFAWLHFYNLHAPGYGPGGIQPKKGTTWNGRYRVSLRWLDNQFERVIKNLERRKLLDRTIIVFSADHGESLGAHNRRAHGPTVYEEEIRVPLAIRIPGVPARRVSTTVGNIDIVPTLWDAIGLPPEPTFRGRSLLAAMFGEPLADVPYYFENYNGQIVGVALGDQKLIHKRKSGTTMRFNVSTDPTEDDNLFEDDAEDAPLLAAMYSKNPELVVATPMMGEIAASLLDRMDAADPGLALRYVLNIAARSDVDDARDGMVELLERTPHDRVKLEVLSALAGADPGRAADVISAELDGIEPSREAQFVEGLASIGAPSVDLDAVEQRFAGPASDPATIAWMRWMAGWDEPAVGGVLTRVVDRVSPEAPPMLLESIAQLIEVAQLDAGERDRLAPFVRTLFDNEEVRVQIAAIEAAAALNDVSAGDSIRQKATAGPIRTQQAAMHALAVLEGAKAVPLIAKLGEDENLVLDAVKAMEKTGSKDAIPFVQRVAKTHYNGQIRSRAKRTLKKLRK